MLPCRLPEMPHLPSVVFHVVDEKSESCAIVGSTPGVHDSGTTELLPPVPVEPASVEPPALEPPLPALPPEPPFEPPAPVRAPPELPPQFMADAVAMTSAESARPFTIIAAVRAIVFWSFLLPRTCGKYGNVSITATNRLTIAVSTCATNDSPSSC